MQRTRLILPVISATVFFLTHFATTAGAQSESHVIVAADHSNSMYMVYSDGMHVTIQDNAIAAAIDTYFRDCNHLQVTYLRWGTYAEQATVFDMNTEHGRQALIAHIKLPVEYGIRTTTNHLVGANAALRQVTATPADNTAVIFITDQGGSPVTTEIPEAVTFYKIALGGDVVAEYLAEEMLPDSGPVYQAETIDELTAIISDTFAAVKTEFCLS